VVVVVIDIDIGRLGMRVCGDRIREIGRGVKGL
jgi:hypothetical protein